MVSLSDQEILTLVIDMSDWDKSTTIIGPNDKGGKLLKTICNQRKLTFKTRNRKAEACNSNSFSELVTSFKLCSEKRKDEIEYKLFQASLTEIITNSFCSPFKSLIRHEPKTQRSYIYRSSSGWLATDSIFYNKFEASSMSPTSLARRARNFVVLLTRIRFVLLRTS